MLALLVLFATLVANIHAVDFMLYSPSTSDSRYLNTITGMGKTYVSVSAAQVSSMNQGSFKAYRALVFADPHCQLSTSYLPSSNLDTMYKAVDGNVVVIGTDELYHWGQGGSTMATSVLRYVASDSSRTGLYASFSCYYHGASPQPVPFLAPLTTDRAFAVMGAPGCFNQAHIVASSPALTGLTSNSASNWSCSVHEVFHSFPKEFIPLAIARGISGTGSLKFADGSFGVPYILARGATLSPVNCGDRVVTQPQEECDSGTGCSAKCKCDDGYKTTAPISVNCALIDYCVSPGTNGKDSGVASCTPGPNVRTITCAAGFYPVGSSMSSSSVTLVGTAPFGGCTTSNLCTVYGYSGKPDNAISCTPGTGTRTITCATGYHARGSAPSTNTVVTLSGSTTFEGCAMIDNCIEYGYSGNPSNAKYCLNGLNSRTIACQDGYAAVAPLTPTVVLAGSAAFGGCKLIDNCVQYGTAPGGPSNVKSCTNGVNTRTITCFDGYYAKAGTLLGPAAEALQYSKGIPYITLTGNTGFEGCAEINRCVVYGCTDVISRAPTTCAVLPSNQRKCTCGDNYFAVGQAQPEPSTSLTGPAAFGGCSPIKACALYGTPANAVCADGAPNTRHITCNPGWYAISPDNPKISVVGATPFAGCKDINECSVYGAAPSPSHVISCTEPAINQRIITCDIGYYATAPDVPTLLLHGNSPFPGCKDINECALFGYSGKSANAQSCTDGVNKRTITCLPGFAAVLPTTPSITLDGSAAFGGCTDIDECREYGTNGDKNVISCVNNAPNQRTITCAAGWAAAAPASASAVLVGSTPFTACVDIDECKVYGYSGLASNTVSCTNSDINKRTIVCATGYYPSGVVGVVSTITLEGSAAFGGCQLVNQCNQYGYSENGKYAASCVPAVASRTITCLPGYWVTGTKSPSVTLGDAATFVGCTEINECNEYGTGGKTDNYESCTDGINQRTMTCKLGYFSAAPDSRSVVIIGSGAFGGCFDIDECKVYGYSGKPSNAISCVEGLNQRTITCKRGYWATAPDEPVITLIGSAAFAGCTDINECEVYRYSGKPENAISCVQGEDTRTITCAAGYAAEAPTKAVTALPGKTEFKGCQQIDMCTTNSNGGNVLKCTNGVNQRTITCVDGYFAQAPSNPVITVVGPVAFPGCTDLSECAVYKCVDIKSSQATTCSDVSPVPVNTRECTCPVGWATVQTPTGRTTSLTGSAVFTGCSEVCGDGLKVGKEECDDGNSNPADGCDKCVITKGYACPTPGSPCVTVCGDGIRSGAETCDDGNKVSGDGCSSTCNKEAGWTCPTPGEPCIIIQLCLTLGYDGKPENTKSCVDAINTRIITCHTGYYAVSPTDPTVKVIGEDKFQGCTLIDNCKVYGYSGNADNTLSCTNSVNQRLIKCVDGYQAVAPSTGEVLLTGSEVFKGCKQIDECAIFGFSGKPGNTESCVDGLLQRTITCQAGFYAQSPATRDVTLKGSAEFGGCFDIDECKVYGDSGKPDNIKSCENLVNSRKITCAPGFAASGATDPTVTLVGDAEFKGCVDIDECKEYGFSGKTEFTESCTTTTPDHRTLTCKPGYFPSGATMDQNTITLTGSIPFGGCSLANQCTTYGFSGKPEKARSCESGVNVRTITCEPGYTASPGTETSVILTGGAPFGGCIDIDECKVYGFSGLPDNTKECVNEENARTIICNDGYAAVPEDKKSVRLIGSAAFTGCFDIDECKVYGFSGKTDNTVSCTTPEVNKRTLTCKDGYWAAAPDKKTVSLTGSESFFGCSLIDTCAVYGYSGFPARTVSCVSDVNKRTITCEAGFMAAPPAEPSVTLIGSAPFESCKEINMCNSYGYGENAHCEVLTPNTRTITCFPGYYAIAPDRAVTTIVGPVAFDGCKDVKECDLYGCPHTGLATTCADSHSTKTVVVNSRVCTCPKGFSPKQLDSLVDGGSITLNGDTPFLGCQETCGDSKILKPETCDDGNVKAGDGCNKDCQIEPGWDCPTPGVPCRDIDECLLYKSRDGRTNVKECIDGINNRTLVCVPGYAAVTPDVDRVTLVGAAEFKGCNLIKGCSVYGASGKDNVHSCEDGINTRTVTCIPGYIVIGQTPATDSIILSGNAPFPGCEKADMCTLYQMKTKKITNGICTNRAVNEFTITCNEGFYAVAPATRSADFVGLNAVFGGCLDIDECAVYGFSSKSSNTKSCTQGDNSRTITCVPGYYAEKPDVPTVTLKGSAPFAGCFDIPECALYGASGKSNVLSCVEYGPNQRTITCEDGYIPLGTKKKSIVLIGKAPFAGCMVVPPICGNGYLEPQIGETCDDGNAVSGDGCSSECKQETGFVCDYPGNACCRDVGEIKTNPLTCENGYWTPRDNPGGDIFVTAEDGAKVNDQVKFCGHVTVDKEDVKVDDNRVILDAATWVIDGTLTVYGSTLQFLRGGNIQLRDGDGKCGISDETRKRQDDGGIFVDPIADTTDFQFWMSHNSTLEYSEVEWDNVEEVPHPILNATKCIFVDGTFSFRAPDIPSGSNEFEAAHADCVTGRMEVAHDIPGTCSDAVTYGTAENKVKVIVNRKHLCHASIFSASLIVGIAGILAIAAVVYLLKAPSAEKTYEGYYTL